MKFIAWLSSVFLPANFNNLSIDEVMSALNDTDVRKHWMVTVLDEIKDVNLRIHAAVMEGSLTAKFAQESARLQGIDWVLRQILSSKTSVDMERHHNQTDDDLDGVAVSPIL